MVAGGSVAAKDPSGGLSIMGDERHNQGRFFDSLVRRADSWHSIGLGLNTVKTVKGYFFFSFLFFFFCVVLFHF